MKANKLLWRNGLRSSTVLLTGKWSDLALVVVVVTVPNLGGQQAEPCEVQQFLLLVFFAMVCWCSSALKVTHWTRKRSLIITPTFSHVFLVFCCSSMWRKPSRTRRTSCPRYRGTLMKIFFFCTTVVRCFVYFVYLMRLFQRFDDSKQNLKNAVLGI